MIARMMLISLILLLTPALAQSSAGEQDLRSLLMSPLDRATGNYTAPEKVAKLRALLKSKPKLANQPIYQLTGNQPSTALVEALKIGNVDAVRVLLEFKAKPNLGLGRWPVTPLQAAIGDLLDGRVKLTQVRLLLAHGANSRLGLHHWAMCQNWLDRQTYFAAADALVQAKAGVNTLDDLGASPLQVAVTYDNVLAVEKLLSLGAKVDDSLIQSAKAGAGTAEGQQIIKLLKLKP